MKENCKHEWVFLHGVDVEDESHFLFYCKYCLETKDININKILDETR